MTSINLGTIYGTHMETMETMDISLISQNLMSDIKNILETIYRGDVYSDEGQYIAIIIVEYIKTFIFATNKDNILDSDDRGYKHYFIFLIMTIIQKLVDLISNISKDYNMKCVSINSRFTSLQHTYLVNASDKLKVDIPNINILADILYHVINNQKHVHTLDYCCKLLLSS